MTTIVSPLTPQLFSLLTALVEARAGLHYSPVDLPIFSDKVSNRLLEAGFTNALDYYYFLRYDPAGEDEVLNLIDALVVGETYLFRELESLRAAVTEVIRPAVLDHGRARIWSAGCSTGEEPFTLAMLVAEEGIFDKVDIIATDVSTRSLARARAGHVPQRSLRALPDNPWARRVAERWITPTETGAKVSPVIVDKIAFHRDSLLDPKVVVSSEIDLILCRNVLIYFQDQVIRNVVEGLTQRLVPGGRLLVGASESLLRFGTMLTCEERGGAFFYRRDKK